MPDLKKELLAAAKEGDADAQYNLGMMLKNGIDDNGYAIEGSKAEAMRTESVKWLLSAAEQDLPRAQLQLAEAYAAGGEAPEDYVRAGGWFLVAMTRLSGVHRHRARSGYELACSRLTPPQIAKATHFAQLWMLKRMAETGLARSLETNGFVVSSSDTPRGRVRQRAKTVWFQIGNV